MNKLFSLFIAVVFLIGCSSGPKLYIVRHAEKGANGQDPDLTEEGKQRAQDLASLLKKKKIYYIYSTQTKRTVQTAVPLSEAINIPVQLYRNDTLQQFLFRVLVRGRNALIVGHSNTTLKMLTDLSLQTTIKEIPDNDYDNLFIVTVKSRSGPADFKLSLKETTYGKKSPVDSSSSSGKSMGSR